MLKLLDLFSGIGGFSLAASWTGAIETIAFCEIEPFCQKVLKKHWPNVPIFPDITKLRGDEVGTVDILTGGFPCQPFSCAGKQRGKDDDRYLWKEMFRIIQETKPTYIIGENVPGIIELALEDCFLDLEAEGYEVQTFIIPACAVNAPHRRDRVWIVAHGASARLERPAMASLQRACDRFAVCCEDVPNTYGLRVEGERPEQQTTRLNQCDWMHWWDIEPDVGRVAHGIPHRVDKLRGLGNSIVPQVVYQLLQGIVDIEKAVTF